MNLLAATMLILLMLAFAPASRAQEQLRLAVGQRGNWATSVAAVGERAGIFKKHGLALDLLYTQGSGETQQAVITASVDIGIANASRSEIPYSFTTSDLGKAAVTQPADDSVATESH